MRMEAIVKRKKQYMSLHNADAPYVNFVFDKHSERSRVNTTL